MLWDFSGQKNHLLLSDRPCITTTGKDDSNFVLSLPIGPWKAFMVIKTERVASNVRKAAQIERMLLEFYLINNRL